jgi:hypothetical protein
VIRFSRLPLLFLFPALVAGCGTSTPTQPDVKTVSVSPSTPAPRSVVKKVAQLRNEYEQSDWAAVGSQIKNPVASRNLIQRMKRWQYENVNNLKTAIVYAHRLSSTKYVATVRFSADDRTVPEYRIFLFRTHGRQASILGTTSGISVSSTAPPRWSVSRTKHFVVYHSPYQLVGSDKSYLASLEYQRAQFSRKFGVKVAPRVVFYLYPDRVSMDQLTAGGCGKAAGEIGCARPYTHPPTIQAVLTAAYHEPVHVYELALAPPPVGKGSGMIAYVAPLFIAEGTAVALQDRSLDPRLSNYCSDLAYAPLDDCARIAGSTVKPLTLLSDAGFKRVDPGYAYSLGGSFVKYLILHHGYVQFGHFYHQLAAQPKDRISDYNVAAKHVYHQPIQVLIDAWFTGLCGEGC